MDPGQHIASLFHCCFRLSGVTQILQPDSPWLEETQNYVLLPTLPISRMPQGISLLLNLPYFTLLYPGVWLPAPVAPNPPTSSTQSKFPPILILYGMQRVHNIVINLSITQIVLFPHPMQRRLNPMRTTNQHPVIHTSLLSRNQTS